MSISGLITCLICATAMTLVAATSRGQTILDKKVSISVKDQSLENAFEQLAKAASVTISYGGNRALEDHLSISANDERLGAILDRLLLNRPFSYISLDDKIIIRFTPEKTKTSKAAPSPVIGKVTDEKGLPLPGATIKVKGTQLVTVTNAEGRFSFASVQPEAILIVSFVGYQPQEVFAKNGADLSIVLQASTSALDEVVIIPYGTTTARFNTGSISKVTAADIASQPISNPLAALEGKVPGLVITQSNGVPGSAFKVLLRGQNSIDPSQNSDPLFIIDGVPFAPNNSSFNQLSSAVGANGLSPFNSINPSDIESVEVLKDADATAIYGSRGAYGVILITTKKGKSGKTQLNAVVTSGISHVTKSPDLLNTQQYLQLRTEAFKNDGVIPTTANAPDLTVFDQNAYTDWKKEFLGNAAHTTDAEASISGGNTETQFLLGGGFHHETTITPGDLGDNRASFHANLSHTSTNKKFTAVFTTNYSSDNNNLLAGDLTSQIFLPPNYPALFDAVGNPVWQYNGVTLANPLAYLKDTYSAVTENLIGNLILSYKISPSLTLRTSGGYNFIQVNEVGTFPSIASNPSNNPTGLSHFGNNKFKSEIVEPQVEYVKQVWAGRLDVLAGGSWQQTINDGSYISATNYTSDNLLRALSAAGTLTASNNYSQYKYAAVFGRINYNWSDKYIINLSGRRDGSSRFGPGKQFANFGAIGGAWLFSNEPYIKNKFSFLSFGKLRGSYGITGSDQIGNYQYLDSWTSTQYAYQGVTGLHPTQLANQNYSWEVNRKTNIALDLGFFNDRVLLSTEYYHNQSSNHLISYQLPVQTGFTSIVENFPAVIENNGWEVSINIKIFDTKNFSWSTYFNLTVPQNKLASFPDLDISSYAGAYVVGKSLSIYKGFEYLGVDPVTGVFKFKDQNGDGSYDNKDMIVVGNRDPKFYGGLQNTLRFKNVTLQFFFEFRKQNGINYLSAIYNTAAYVPGMMTNQSTAILGRWGTPGQQTTYQKLTATTGTGAYTAAGLISSNGNSAVFSDASFIRLKNLSLSYNLPSSWMKHLRITNMEVFLQGQNLLTLTNYLGNDPETQSWYTMPPLKTIVAGIRINL